MRNDEQAKKRAAQADLKKEAEKKRQKKLPKVDDWDSFQLKNNIPAPQAGPLAFGARLQVAANFLDKANANRRLCDCGIPVAEPARCEKLGSPNFGNLFVNCDAGVCHYFRWVKDCPDLAHLQKPPAIIELQESSEDSFDFATSYLDAPTPPKKQPKKALVPVKKEYTPPPKSETVAMDTDSSDDTYALSNDGPDQNQVLQELLDISSEIRANLTQETKKIKKGINSPNLLFEISFLGFTLNFSTRFFHKV